VKDADQLRVRRIMARAAAEARPIRALELAFKAAPF